MNKKMKQALENIDPVFPESTPAIGTIVTVLTSCNRPRDTMRLTSSFLPYDQFISLPSKVMFLILIMPAVTCAGEFSRRAAASFVGNSEANAGGAGILPNMLLACLRNELFKSAT